MQALSARSEVFVVIGPTGDGKSTLLNLLGGTTSNGFKEGFGSNSVTTLTEVQQRPWLGTGKTITFVDTQGLHDTKGLDSVHIEQMVSEIKRLGYVDMVAIVLNGTNVRFTPYTKETIQLFINIFSVHVLHHIVLVFTHWSLLEHTVDDEKQISAEYNELFKKYFVCSHQIPCFFIDSHFNRLNVRGRYTYDGVDKNEYQARLQNMFGTLISMDKLDVTPGAITPQTPNFFTSKLSGKVLEVHSASMSNCAQIIQNDKHGNPNQKFRLIPTIDGYHYISAEHSGKVLEVHSASMSNCAQIVQHDKHGGTNQQFQLTEISSGYYTIRARHSRKLLDVIGGSLNNCAQIVQYDYHGGPNQLWKINQ